MYTYYIDFEVWKRLYANPLNVTTACRGRRDETYTIRLSFILYYYKCNDIACTPDGKSYVTARLQYMLYCKQIK